MTKAKPLDPKECAALYATDRFHSKYVKTDDCWLWTATKTCGYGTIRLSNGRRMVKAHRVAWIAMNGRDVREHYELDHLCRNRACVNPAHLEEVTRLENQLRGEGVVRRNASKTHCPQGHPLETTNLVNCEALEGHRVCKTCMNARAKEQRALVMQACSMLGLSRRKYAAIYGQGAEAALAVIERYERGASSGTDRT